MQIKPTLIVIGGPTASGKTRLAIDLAKHYNCEIFSADSRQLYKELDIGVAKPSKEELAEVKHHFISHISIDQSYSAAQYESDLLNVLEIYFKTNQTAILVGGTGLYIKAVLEGLDHFPEVSQTILAQLEESLTQDGLEPLVNELKSLDIITYDNIDLNNSRRVVRALSVCLSIGQAYSSFLSESKESRPFESIKLYLNPDRELLYQRINERVDQMVDRGLIEEVKSLLDKQHLKSLDTIGYREIFKYLNGEWTLVTAIDKLKQHSRNYAKRQLTWFKNTYQGYPIENPEINKLTNMIEKLKNR